MAKFRSWNEKIKCFVYFADGLYFIDETSKIPDDPLGVFDWKNAEQEFSRNGLIVFVGDKFKLSDDYYGVVAFRNGVLGFDVYEHGTNDLITFEDIYWSYSYSIEKIGNIHEEEEDDKNNI